MAFQRIRIKNTNVIGKIPGADKLDTAELCINLKDQKLYSKDADGNVFELGKTAVNNGPTPPSNGNETGDLWWDGDNLLVWNGSSWEIVGAVTSVNGEVGDVVLELGDLDDVAVDGVVDEQVLVYDGNQGKWVPASAASLAVDVDLDYTAAPDKGTVANSAGDDAELPLVDATNAGLMSPADYSKLAAMPGVISGPIQPNNPSPGDIWIDTGDCPPTINVWDDCDDPGNPTWKPIGGGGGGGCVQGPVQITSSNGTELNSTLTAVGGNGVDDSTTLTATYEWTGAKTGTGSSIVADVEGNYTVTASITCVDGSVLRNSAVWTVSDSYVDMVNNTPPVIAVVGGGVDEAYEGNSIYVVTNATVLNGEIPSIVETQWFKDGTADGTGSIYTIGADDEGAAITAKQLFRDLRSNELLSLASNAITIVERPADAITFTAVITDDGTLTGNTPSHVLTASATNIVGGTAPGEYAYQWKSGGVATVTTKTYTLVEGDVGKIITCDVTVAEPDGSNPEIRTATYAKVIEIAGTINKPTVLAPEDGAGSGVTRPIVTDEIIAVEGGGIDTCETELIESVETVNADTHYDQQMTASASTNVIENPNTITGWVDTTLNNTNLTGDASVIFARFNNPTIAVFSKITAGCGSSATHYMVYWDDNTSEWVVDTKYVGGLCQGSLNDSIVGKSAATTWALFRPNPDPNLADGERFNATRSFNFQIVTDFTTPNWGFVYDSQFTPTTLTFPSAQGFDCFEVGDEVQSDAIVGDFISKLSVNTGTLSDASKNNAFDGDTSTECLGSSSASMITFDLSANPISYKSKVEIYTGSPYDEGRINDSAFVDMTQSAWTTLATGSGVIYKIEVKDDSAKPAWTAIKVDGKYLIDSSLYTGDEVKVISKDDSDPYTITVDGGTWTTSDKLVKETPYDTKLTLAGAKDLADLTVGDTVKMGLAADVPYQPVSDEIVTVEPDTPSVGETTLTLSGPTDLAYFRQGDVVQGPVKIISIDDTVPSITVDGGEWDSSNQSQVWSSLVSNPGGTLDGDVSNGFNGNPNASYVTYSGGAFPANCAQLDIPILSTDKVIAIVQSDLAPFLVDAGNGTQTFIQTSGPNTRIDISSAFTSDVTSWKIGSTGNWNFSGIEINGKILVDAVNDSQVWSSVVTTGSGMVGDVTAAFNGEASPNFGGTLNNEECWIEFPDSTTLGGKQVEVYSINGNTKEQYWSLTQGTGDLQRSDLKPSWTDLGVAPANQTRLYCYGSSNPYFTMIRVDGMLLVDRGVRDLGDTEVICQSPLKAPTDWKIEGIEGNTLSLSHATPDDNAQVWVANDNQAGTDFYVTGPSIVDDPLLTADVELESSLFATTPPGVDTLNNIVWELNGVEQNAGTSNPYKPTLSINTTYTVRVKHQGNALDDSPWSDQTTFTTGATRNIYTYYKERVELLEARLAGIEADEIVDDATDVTLLTAFANLVERVEALENP